MSEDHQATVLVSPDMVGLYALLIDRPGFDWDADLNADPIPLEVREYAEAAMAAVVTGLRERFPDTGLLFAWREDGGV